MIINTMFIYQDNTCKPKILLMKEINEKIFNYLETNNNQEINNHFIDFVKLVDKFMNLCLLVEDSTDDIVYLLNYNYSHILNIDSKIAKDSNLYNMIKKIIYETIYNVSYEIENGKYNLLIASILNRVITFDILQNDILLNKITKKYNINSENNINIRNGSYFFVSNKINLEIEQIEIDFEVKYTEYGGRVGSISCRIPLCNTYTQIKQMVKKICNNNMYINSDFIDIYIDGKIKKVKQEKDGGGREDYFQGIQSVYKLKIDGKEVFNPFYTEGKRYPIFIYDNYLFLYNTDVENSECEIIRIG